MIGVCISNLSVSWYVLINLIVKSRALLNLVICFFPEYQTMNKLYLFLPHVCKLFFCHISVDMQDEFVDMQDNFVNMQHSYVDIQEN